LSITPLMTVSESTSSSRPRVGGATVRKAKLPDAVNIFDLVNSLSGDGTLLRRNYAEICENIRDFAVAESPIEGDSGGVFLGCGALHLYGPHLAEVRSIVVKPEAKGQGAGGRLLRALLEEAEEQKGHRRLPLHPHPRLLLPLRLPRSRPHHPARQDLQGLPDLPASLRLRRSRHGPRPSTKDRRPWPITHSPTRASQAANGRSPSRRLDPRVYPSDQREDQRRKILPRKSTQVTK
jgi:N-acetylglutamate synthase-like GNAT family acetyltransferase